MGRDMKVRILHQPIDPPREKALEHYRVGLVYDLPPFIASYLVAEGLAVETRRVLKSPKAQRVDLHRFREFINEHREGKKMRPA